MPELAADVIKQWEHLEGQRGPWKSHWQQVTDYVLPDRADYYVVKTAGTKRMQKVFDATPVWALQQFASGLHSLLTSPTLRWFGCKPDEDHLADDHDAHQWWDIVTEVMYGIFNGASHNFASQSHELYLDLGAVGTGVMSVTESDQSGILFSTRHLRECCIAENDEDRVDTLIRRWFSTAKQAAHRWGAAAGPAVLKAYEETPDKLFEFLHAVRPRKERALGRSDRRNKAWESVYVSLADKSEIDVGGFDDFPYLVPRFSKITGETYGRGPGMWCLPDIQMLNVMGKTVLKAAQKIVDPPLFIPDDGYIVPIKTEPGSFGDAEAHEDIGAYAKQLGEALTPAEHGRALELWHDGHTAEDAVVQALEEQANGHAHAINHAAGGEFDHDIPFEFEAAPPAREPVAGDVPPSSGLADAEASGRAARPPPAEDRGAGHQEGPLGGAPGVPAPELERALSEMAAAAKASGAERSTLDRELAAAEAAHLEAETAGRALDADERAALEATQPALEFARQVEPALTTAAECLIAGEAA